MEDHILYEDDITNLTAPTYKEVDNKILETLVNESREYLKKIIDNYSK